MKKPSRSNSYKLYEEGRFVPLDEVDLPEAEIIVESADRGPGRAGLVPTYFFTVVDGRKDSGRDAGPSIDAAVRRVCESRQPKVEGSGPAASDNEAPAAEVRAPRRASSAYGSTMAQSADMPFPLLPVALTTLILFALAL